MSNTIINHILFLWHHGQAGFFVLFIYFLIIISIGELIVKWLSRLFNFIVSTIKYHTEERSNHFYLVIIIFSVLLIVVISFIFHSINLF